MQVIINLLLVLASCFGAVPGSNAPWNSFNNNLQKPCSSCKRQQTRAHYIYNAWKNECSTHPCTP